MKKKFLVIAFVLINTLLSAQQKNSVYRFHSVNSIALINGSNAASSALQSVNGFKKGAWFAGIGTGIDYYLYRTVPIFADMRYESGKKKNNFFAYADAGMNISWIQDNLNTNPVIWDGNNGTSVYKNGLYMDAGIGYNIGVKKENALVISLGRSYKSLKETKTYQDWRSKEWFTTRNTYNLNRIMLKIGWQF